MNKDEYYMNLALLESKKARINSSPNPDVGAIIVKNNRIISKGYTQAFGGAHAEVDAINKVPDSLLRGSTMYVTLEPCSHYGKTPPCTDLIIRKKIKRVVIGMIDPNPVVCGNGISKLKQNGIDVTYGVLENKIVDNLQWFIKYIKKKLPYVTLKSGISLDGKITDYKDNSQWITSESARKLSQKLREVNDAILVGINTVLKDNPSLTYRGTKKKNRFIRIIMDSYLKIPPKAKVLKKVPDHKTIIITSERNYNNPKIKKFKDIDFIYVEERNGYLNLKETLKEIRKLNIGKIIIEGGAEINFSFLKDNLVDKINLFVAPKIIGGKESKSFVGGMGFTLQKSIKIKKGHFINYAIDNYIYEGVINYYVHRFNK